VSLEIFDDPELDRALASGLSSLAPEVEAVDVTLAELRPRFHRARTRRRCASHARRPPVPGCPPCPAPFLYCIFPHREFASIGNTKALIWRIHLEGRTDMDLNKAGVRGLGAGILTENRVAVSKRQVPASPARSASVITPN
jgi:hypothetical protein